MVCPMEKFPCVISPCTLLAAVNAATAVAPYRLMAACMIIVPDAVMPN